MAWKWRGRLPNKRDFQSAKIGGWYWNEAPQMYYLIGPSWGDLAELDPKTKMVHSPNTQSPIFKAEMEKHCELVKKRKKEE